MVDPTKNIGQIPGISTIGKSQPATSTRRTEENQQAKAVGDSVEISSEASEAQANEAAAKARVVLENNRELSLGLNPSLLDETV